MCLILDANCYGAYFNKKHKNYANMAPVRQWVKTKGRLAYSPTPSLQRELNNGMRKLLRTGRQREAINIKIVNSDDVQRKEKELKNNHDLKSNDPHIIALALVGNVKLLVSQDQKLGDDFKKIVKGNIYMPTDNNSRNNIKVKTRLLSQNKCR